MDQVRVTAYLTQNRHLLFSNSKYKYKEVETLLLSTPVDAFYLNTNFRSTGLALVLSFFLGALGVDRFFVGDYIYAVVKLMVTLLSAFLSPVSFILWFIDLFIIKKRCRTFNCKRLIKNAMTVYDPRAYTPPTVPINNTVPINKTVPLNDDQQGDFVFLSYAHRDRDKVMPLFAELQRQNVKIWYDEGIRAGSEWEEEIIDNLGRCSGFLFFVSENSLNSSNCRDELHQARNQDKKFINILIEDIDLTKKDYRWFDFRYSRYQQIPAYTMSAEDVVKKVVGGLR